MSTKVLNIGKKKYKFLKKKDRLNLVKIGEFREWTEPVPQEKLKKPNFTFFREALEHWSELDVSADFVSFRKKTSLYGYSLSLLLAKRRRIVKLLLSRLRKRPKTIAFQSLCGCLVAFARDIRHRFVEYIPVSWKVLTDFMDFENEEILSCIFSTLNSLGKLLWEPMLKHFPKTWILWRPLVVHKTRQIRELAAACFGFVLRKGVLEDVLPNIITRMLQEVLIPRQDSIQSREIFQYIMDGVCECFMQMLFSPIGKQLLSKSDIVLKTLLEKVFLSGDLNCFSGFLVLQQLFVKILRQIPESGSQWIMTHLIVILRHRLQLVKEKVAPMNHTESTDSLLIFLIGFCCENDSCHSIAVDDIWESFRLITQCTESHSIDIFSYCCLYYCLENLMLLLSRKDASSLNMFWDVLMQKYVDSAYFSLFLERVIVSLSNQPKFVDMLRNDALKYYWKQFQSFPQNPLHWRVVLALWRQHLEPDISIEGLRFLFTAALSSISNDALETRLFMSLLDICCEIKDEGILREWELFLENNYLNNSQITFSSKCLMARVCSKMLNSGCGLSNIFHVWFQEFVFFQGLMEPEILHAALISLQSQGILHTQVIDCFKLEESVPSNWIKCLLFSSLKRRQAMMELLSTVGKLVEWKEYSVLELILAVDKVPKIPTYISESLLKTQRVIDYLHMRRNELTVAAEESPVLSVLILEAMNWLVSELSPVQINIHKIWKCLCGLCPSAVVSIVKDVLSTDLPWKTENSYVLEQQSSSVICNEHSSSTIMRWMQPNQKHFQSFQSYYEALESLQDREPTCNSNRKSLELSSMMEKDHKDENRLEERAHFLSWHIQLIKAVENSLPESGLVALHLLNKYFIGLVSTTCSKNPSVESNVKLIECYLSLFIRCYEEQHHCKSFPEWIKDNYQDIEIGILSIIAYGKGNAPQLALSCQVRCLQPFLAPYESWLSQLQSRKHFKEIYTHVYAAIFQNNTEIETSKSSISIQTVHLEDVRKLVLHILVGKLNEASSKDKLQTSIFTLLSDFRASEDIHLLWHLLWLPLLDDMAFYQIEQVLEHIKEVPWKEILWFHRCWETIFKAIPLSLFTWNMRETLLKWCIACFNKTLQENENVERERNKQQLRSSSLHLLSCIIDSSRPLSDCMITDVFEWLLCIRPTLERYQPSGGQTPALVVTLDKITYCEPLTNRILGDEQLCQSCIELVLRIMEYYPQNEQTILHCMSIWKHLWNIAHEKNISFGWLETKSSRDKIWVSLANNILRIWDNMKRPYEKQSKKLQLLNSLLEWIFEYDYHQRITVALDENLKNTFQHLLQRIACAIGDVHYWKSVPFIAEKSKDLLVLYIQRMSGQELLSYYIHSKLPCILFQFKMILVEDNKVRHNMDMMFLELCKTLAEQLSEKWLNIVMEHLPLMLSTQQENIADCGDIEKRANALNVVISDLESLFHSSREQSCSYLNDSNEDCQHPSCLALVLLSYACLRNIALDDLSLRTLIGRGLTVVGRCLLSKLANGIRDVSISSIECDVVLQQLVDACNMLLFSQLSFGIQRVLLMTLGTWVYTWYAFRSQSSCKTTRIPCLECFFPMISDNSRNIEESWFSNMVHLQIHRRCRACIEVCRKVDIGQPFVSRLLEFVISWTFQRCIESVNTNEDGTVERWYEVMRVLLDSSVHKIAWKDYKRYLERIIKKWIHLKNSMHPVSKKEWNVWVKLGEIFITYLPKWMEVDNKSTETYQGEDTNQKTIHFSPCQVYMEEKLIPFIARLLTELSYSSVTIGEKKYSSITPQFADLLIRALQSLSESQREKYANDILRYLTSQIRSKSQRQRDLARSCFCTILKRWGVCYLRPIFDAMKASCQDGFRIYVLRYSTYCYVKCLAESKMVVQDTKLIREWMNIFHDEISSVVDDQENRIPYQECKEVSSFYIYDAITLLAKISQGKEKWDLWKDFLTTCSELNEVRNPSKKKKLLHHLFPRLVKSFSCCEMDINQALWFVYSLMKERQPLKEGQHNDKNDYYLDESSILVVEFALQLLYRLLKRLNSQADPSEYKKVLETFFPLITQLFRTRNELLCSYSLKVIQLLWKVTALPCTPKHWSNIFQYASGLLSNASRQNGLDSSSNSLMVNAAVRTLSTVISKIPPNYHKDKSWQEDYLLPLMRIAQQLLLHVSGDQLPPLLQLIRTFVKCRLGFRAPEMFSLMNALSELAIQSSEKVVRDNITSIWIDFILHYPVPESVFQQYVQYFTSNLEYPYSFGRMTSASILSKWLQASYASPIWKVNQVSLFLAVSAQKANEEDRECRKSLSDLLTTIFSCMDEQRRLDVLQMTEHWSSSEKEKLQLVAISVAESVLDTCNLRKSEFLVLLKASRNCLQSLCLKFASLEATDVHFAYASLLSCLERILKCQPDWIVRDTFLDIWNCMCKNNLFAANILPVRRNLDTLIRSLISSLETMNNTALERKAQQLLLGDTFLLSKLLNCCVHHLTVDPLTFDSAKCISDNMNRIIHWMEKYRTDAILESTVEATSLDCLKKLCKIAAAPNLPSDGCGTFRRRVAAELVRDRLKMDESLWSIHIGKESYTRPILRMMLRCWRDFGEVRTLNRKRKRSSNKPREDEIEMIQLVICDIENLLSSKMSSTYHTMLSNLREEYLRRRRARKIKK